jgi:predicted amidohydrolase
MNKKLRVAIGSTIGYVGDLEKNFLQFEELAKCSERDKVDILLTPELSATGYGSYEAVLQCSEEAGKGIVYNKVSTLARNSGTVFCVGFPEKFLDKKFISHYIIYPDGRFFVQRKHRVTPEELPFNTPFPISSWGDADNQAQPQKVNFEIFKVKDVKCAISICADMGLNNLNQIFGDAKVEFLLIPTGAGGRREDRFTLEELKKDENIKHFNEVLATITYGESQGFAIKYKRSQAAVNICGFDNFKHYHGGSGSIINSMGELIATTPFFAILGRERLTYAFADIDFSDTIGD